MYPAVVREVAMVVFAFFLALVGEGADMMVFDGRRKAEDDEQRIV